MIIAWYCCIMLVDMVASVLTCSSEEHVTMLIQIVK